MQLLFLVCEKRQLEKNCMLWIQPTGVSYQYVSSQLKDSYRHDHACWKTVTDQGSSQLEDNCRPRTKPVARQLWIKGQASQKTTADQEPSQLEVNCRSKVKSARQTTADQESSQLEDHCRSRAKPAEIPLQIKAQASSGQLQIKDQASWKTTANQGLSQLEDQASWRTNVNRGPGQLEGKCRSRTEPAGEQQKSGSIVSLWLVANKWTIM